MQRNSSASAIEAFLALMGRFADSTGLPATRVTVMNRVEPSALEGKDILVVGASSLAGSDALFGGSPVRFSNGGLQVTERSPFQNAQNFFALGARSSPEDAQQIIYNARGFSGIAGFRSPFDSERSVVAVLADDPNALPQLVNGMADTKINAQIQGDLAVTDGEGMTSFAVGPTYWVGSLPIWMRIAYWFSQRPILMAASGLLLALLLAGPAYLYFNSQAKRRLDGADEA
jgi:cellulose synthase (UDP-forming)